MREDEFCFGWLNYYPIIDIVECVLQQQIVIHQAIWEAFTRSSDVSGSMTFKSVCGKEKEISFTKSRVKHKQFSNNY